MSALNQFHMRPRTTSGAAQTAFSALFSESPVKRNRSGFTYSTHNDFGREVHRFLLSVSTQGLNSWFFQDMAAIANITGFRIQSTEQNAPFYSVRDVKLMDVKNVVLQSTRSKNAAVAVDRLRQRSHVLKNHSASLATHPSFYNQTIGQVARSELHHRSGDGLLVPSKPSRIYFEGGNCFRITNQHQKPYYIIGEDLLTATHQTLLLDGWFYAPNPKNPTPAYTAANNLLKNDHTPFNDWYLEGLIPELIKKMAEDLSPSLSDAEIESILLEIHAMMLPSIKITSEADKIKARQIAANYMAQKEFVKTHIFPEELSCSASEIIYVSQVAYHLDLMMAPGPKGSVFVQDYDLVLATLGSISENAQRFNLSAFDLKTLDTFVDMALKLTDELSPLLSKVKQQLVHAGFIVIPTPGAFFGCNKEGQNIDINFINCLTGFSSQTGRYYYIAAGAENGESNDRLGKIFMDLYTEFLQSHCNNTDVYFVGKNPQNEDDFSEILRTLTKKGAGPHCLACEIEIASHTEMSEDREHNSQKDMEEKD